MAFAMATHAASANEFEPPAGLGCGIQFGRSASIVRQRHAVNPTAHTNRKQPHAPDCSLANLYGAQKFEIQHSDDNTQSEHDGRNAQDKSGKALQARFMITIAHHPSQRKTADHGNHRRRKCIHPSQERVVGFGWWLCRVSHRLQLDTKVRHRNARVMPVDHRYRESVEATQSYTSAVGCCKHMALRQLV